MQNSSLAVDITSLTREIKNFGANPKLSKTSKMPVGCKSWSLQAGTTCPASANDSGCDGCYAKKGAYRWSPAINAREHNRSDWKKDGWVDAMVLAIGKGGKKGLFRWFDSGDCYSVILAEKIYQVMLKTPHVKHWLPTRMNLFPKFSDVFARMAQLANVVVRFSARGIDAMPKTESTSSIIFTSKSAPKGVTVCHATARPKGDPKRGKCGECTACWNKEVAIIGYAFH